jgi:branched-chain amino acid transport system ATP-binding protein
LARPEARTATALAFAATGEAPLLSIDGLTVAYGAVTAIRNVSLTVGAGEVVALLGANGAGKSTMLRAISGIVRPRAGQIRLAGQAITRLPPARIVRLGIGHCPEGRRIFGSLSVAENLRLGAAARSDRTEVAEDRERMLALFPILRERQQQPAGTLSGGEQQMLALA